jgi:hypothetical protein
MSLDPQILNTLYTLGSIVGAAVAATVFVMDTLGSIVGAAVAATVFVMDRLNRRDRGQQHHHQTTADESPIVNDITRDLTAYIRCMEIMMEENRPKLMADSTTTSDKDREFFRRFDVELVNYLVRYQRELIARRPRTI